MMFMRAYSLFAFWLISYKQSVLAADIAAELRPLTSQRSKDMSPVQLQQMVETMGSSQSAAEGPTSSLALNLATTPPISVQMYTGPAPTNDPFVSITSIPTPSSSSLNAECQSNMMSIGLVEYSPTANYAPALETAVVVTINATSYNMLVDVNEKETYLFSENYMDVCNSNPCQVPKTYGKNAPSRQIPSEEPKLISANITIGNITFGGFPLWVFPEVSSSTESDSAFNVSIYSGLQGVIGLDYGSTFIQASGQACGTSSNYGLYLGRSQNTTNNTALSHIPGTLIIGGYDASKTNLTSNQELPTSNLSVAISPFYNNGSSDSGSVAKAASEFPIRMMASIDSLSTWNWLPDSVYEAWNLNPSPNPSDMSSIMNLNVDFTDFSMEPIQLDSRMFRRYNDSTINYVILGQPFLAHAYITRSDSKTLWNTVDSTSTSGVTQQVFGSPAASGSPPAGSSSSPNDSSVPAGSGQTHHSITGALVGGILGGILGLILILIACICLLRRRRRNKNRQSRESMQPMRSHGSGIFNNNDSNMSYPPILPPPPIQPSDDIHNMNTTSDHNNSNNNNNNNNPFMYQQANYNTSTTSEIAAKTMEMSPIVHTRQERGLNSSSRDHGGGGGEESDEEGDVDDVNADRRSLVSEPYHEGISPVQPRNSMGLTSANAPRLPFSRISVAGLHDGSSGGGGSGAL